MPAFRQAPFYGCHVSEQTVPEAPTAGSEVRSRPRGIERDQLYWETIGIQYPQSQAVIGADINRTGFLFFQFWNR